VRRAEPLVLGLSPTLLLPRRLEPAEDEDLEPDLKPARGPTPTAGGGAGRAEAEAGPPARARGGSRRRQEAGGRGRRAGEGAGAGADRAGAAAVQGPHRRVPARAGTRTDPSADSRQCQVQLCWIRTWIVCACVRESNIPPLIAGSEAGVIWGQGEA